MNNETSMFAPEEFLQIPPTMAKAIGLREAIILQRLHFLLRLSTNGREIDGERWIFNTYEQWHSQHFAFLTIFEVKRTFQNLEKMRYVVSCQPEGRMNRRKYYRIPRSAYTNLTLERYEGSKTLPSSEQSAPIRKGAICSLPSTKNTQRVPAKKGKGSTSATDSSFSLRYSYPLTEESMYDLLEENGYEIYPDHDGGFFNQMVKSNWSIKGKPIYDWMKTYVARVQKTTLENW